MTITTMPSRALAYDGLIAHIIELQDLLEQLDASATCRTIRHLRGEYHQTHHACPAEARLHEAITRARRPIGLGDPSR